MITDAILALKQRSLEDKVLEHLTKQYKNVDNIVVKSTLEQMLDSGKLSQDKGRLKVTETKSKTTTPAAKSARKSRNASTASKRNKAESEPSTKQMVEEKRSRSPSSNGEDDNKQDDDKMAVETPKQSLKKASVSPQKTSAKQDS